MIALGDYRTLRHRLLHEAAHSLGYKHPGKTSAPYTTLVDVRLSGFESSDEVPLPR